MATPRQPSAQRWFASHELRTPLQAIKGGVELLLEERGTGLSALQVEALSLIAGATAELERCVAMLAELASLEAETATRAEPQPLGAWLASPEIERHLTPTPQLRAVAGLDVLIGSAMAARALDCLAKIAAPIDCPAPIACDLACVEPTSCALSLSIGPSAGGNGAVAWQLATVLFERAGATVRPSGAETTVLTLRRVR